MTSLAIQPLLTKVCIEREARQKAKQYYAREMAPDFHLLDYLERNEMALSRYLALLWDSRGAHGQGELYLHAWLHSLLGESLPDWCAPSELQQIRLEVATDENRRIDIVLYFTNGTIGVENKPWAIDQDQQLAHYLDYLKKQNANGNYLLVYLCNREPSEASLPVRLAKRHAASNHFVMYSFQQLASLLDDCVLKTRAANVRLWLEALASFIHRKINGELDVADAEHIKQIILQNDGFLEAAMEVAGSLHHVKQTILDEFKEKLEAELQRLNMSLEWDSDALLRRSKDNAFHIVLASDFKFDLSFMFAAAGANKLEWGICEAQSTRITRKSYAEFAPKIAKIMDKYFGQGEHQEEFWPWYSAYGATNQVFSTDERDWGASAIPWQRMRDETDAGFLYRIVELAQEVKHLLSSVMQEMRTQAKK